MFLPGERAIAHQERNPVTILPGKAPPVKGLRWPVLTSAGVFDEANLLPAHPSVLATASGRDPQREAWLAMQRDAAVLSPAQTERMDRFSHVGKEIEAALRRGTLDLNGHWKGGAALGPGLNPLDNLFLGYLSIPLADLDDLVQAVRTKTTLDRWVPLRSALGMTGLRKCPYCDEETTAAETNGAVVRLAGARCAFAQGLPPNEWELNIPSGKLVIANDLRAWFPVLDDEKGIGTFSGNRAISLAYAKVGLAHGFVGNTCPGVYRCADGSYKIAHPPDGAPASYGEPVGGICTDLWWYSLADHDELERRRAYFKRDIDGERITVLDVRPGVYRFKHDDDAAGTYGAEECVYARFAWVREPDPVGDLLASYTNVEINPHAYVQAMAARWPTIYGKVEKKGGQEVAVPWSAMDEEDRARAWRSNADQVFFVIGAGIDWHEKGFPLAKVDPTIPDVDPPALRAQYPWYPFSKGYGGLFDDAQKLSPAFARWAFRVLESVISFGMHVGDDNHHRKVTDVRERMLLAVKRYRQLAKRYPAEADPAYVAWLGQKGRAEAWVAKFDLGPEYTDKHVRHAEGQRWVPETAYAVAFDARKLVQGHFARHPDTPLIGKFWADKRHAERYAISGWSDNGKEDPRANCYWPCSPADTSVPLFTVARVVKLGDVSHMGETLVEVQYDYGTPWMRDHSKRKALRERSERDGIKVLTKKQYERLLPKAVKFYEDGEAAMKAKRKGKKRRA